MPETADQSVLEAGITILIPVFNDWTVLGKLLPILDRALAEQSMTAEVLAVNDGSTEPAPESYLAGLNFAALRSIRLLNLRRNLGHQRAIAIGLAYLQQAVAGHLVVVMDGDGEDDPVDVPRLVQRCRECQLQRIVFAERVRRSEKPIFKIFYALFKLTHLLLVGKRIRVGNFSAIPPARLASLTAATELWIHYAAAVFASRQPHDSIPTQRAKRLGGHSKMNFVRLVVHGLSAMSVYGDIVGVRLLIVAAFMAVGLIALSVVVAIFSGVGWSVPAWGGMAIAFSLVIAFQAMLLCLIFIFITMGLKTSASFVPIRDYAVFIASVTPLHESR